MFHKPVRTTFKLNPTNGLTGSVVKSLVSEDHTNVGAFVDYVIDTLEAYSFALVRNQSFSLINVTGLKQNQSIGYSTVELPDIKLPSGAAFTMTFALTPRPPQKVVPKASESGTMIKLRNFDVVWGRKASHYEYLTLVVDFATARKFSIDYALMKDLQAIYNVVGCYTKSFVLNPNGRFTSSVYSNNSLPMLRAQYLTKPLNLLIRDVPCGYWIYNKYFWQELIHLVIERSIDDRFYKYFVVHLLNSVPASGSGPGSNWLLKPDHKGGLIQFIKSGLRKFVQAVNGSSYSVQDDDLYSVCYLLNEALIDGSFGDTQSFLDCVAFIADFRLALEPTNDNAAANKQFLMASMRDMDQAAYDLVHAPTALHIMVREVLR